MMIVPPGLPRGERPLADASNVVFRVNGAVHMEDGEHSTLPRSRVVRAHEGSWAVEPLLDGSIRFSRVALLERRVHARHVRRVRLRRPHVLRGMLKRVDVDGQPVRSSVSVIAELPRENFVEQALTSLATAGNGRSTFRAGRGNSMCRCRGHRDPVRLTLDHARHRLAPAGHSPRRNLSAAEKNASGCSKNGKWPLFGMISSRAFGKTMAHSLADSSGIGSSEP